MLALVFLASAHAAEARLEWKGGVGRVAIVAPGEHVSPEAPTVLTIGGTRVELRGDPGAVRVPVAAGPVEVALELALCTDASTACRVVRFDGKGEIAGRRGALALAERVARPEAAAPAASGVVKVLDFGAVWCPPCNLLAAEVLHDASATAGLPIEAIDVDRPTSWEAKDRYAVGGYPTLVAVDAAGREVDRLVGYPGAVATRAWFGRLRDAVPIELLAQRTDTLTGAEAAAAARRLAEAGREEAARTLLARASDTVDLHVARLLLADPPSSAAADAAWLFDRHVPAGDWVYTALDALPARWTDAAAYAAATPPAQGADLLYAAAEHAPKEAAPALKSAALALLRAAQTGEPDADRGHVTFLAELMAETGDLPGAIALLDANSTRYPEEFTFAFAAARQLFEAGQLPAAETQAKEALRRAWGDQRLRAAAVYAKIVSASGRPADARAAIDAALAEVPAPPEGVEVRTTRYRRELETLRAGLQ